MPILNSVKENGSRKLFHSYCHKDENYSRELEKRLFTMKKNGLIDDWSDRKISPGSDLSEEIRENLRTSDIFLFLVSPDFLASEECLKELKEASELVESNKDKKKLVPVILKPCDWKNESRIKKFLALPKDGKPITSWNNTDEAWEDVRRGIERAAFDIQDDSCFALNPTFKNEYLNDTEIHLTHPNIPEIKLDSLFVYPDIEICEQEEISEERKNISSEKLINTDSISDTRIILEGEEQSGKSSLLKTLFQKLHDNEFLPVIIKGQKIINCNFDENLSDLFNEQYIGNTFENFIQDSRQKVIIIDDWHLAKINRDNRGKFLEQIQNKNYGIIISVDDVYGLAEYNLKRSKEIAGFDHYRIRPFGHELRANLIEKWLCLGNVHENNLSNEVLRKCDRYKEHIDLILGKNIVPAYPLFIILILQMKEVQSPHDLSLTAYGHYYQVLIFGCLNKKADIKQENIDSYINYLTEFAYYIFNKEALYISESEIEDFTKQYSEEFNFQITQGEITQKLQKGKILSVNSSMQYMFKYNYIYYYFVAKYLAEHTQESKIRKTIKQLCSKIHIKEYANIMIFLSHHSRENFIIDEIMENAMKTFQSEIPASLSRETVSFLEQFMEQIEIEPLKPTNPKQERKTRLRRKDDIEEYQESNDLENNSTNIASLLNQGFKTTELIGQILKNRHGSLSRERLIQLLVKGEELGLRMLSNFHMLFVKTDVDSLIKEIANYRKTTTDQIDKEQIRKFIALFGYWVTFVFLRKISYSLGSDKLLQIADEADKNINTPSSNLINLSIHQWFGKELSTRKIEELKKSFSNNPFANRMLIECVRDHIYMHHVDSAKTHKIANLLGIPIRDQIIRREKGKK